MTWVRIDDEFPGHPKSLVGGPLAELLQQRACCYCSRYLTDGYLPRHVLPLLLVGFERLTVDGQPALGIDWPALMVRIRVPNSKHGLWEETDGGWLVHDYLDYNPSRRQVEQLRRKKAESGQAGGQASASARAKARASATGAAGAQAKAKRKSTTSPSPSPSPPEREKRTQNGEDCSDRTPDASVADEAATGEECGGKPDRTPSADGAALDPALKAILNECPHLRLVNNGASAEFWDQVLGACEPYPVADGRWLGVTLRNWNQWFETHKSRRSVDRKRLESRLMGWLRQDLEKLARRAG